MENEGIFASTGIIYLIIAVIMIVSLWKVFTKAKQPGWGCIIPIYNIYLMLVIAKRPAWWLILYFIPIVNIVILLLVSLDIAKRFGKGTGFGLGLFFLSIIFYPILAFSDAKYKG